MDFYIAYEVDNPLNMFFYKPVGISTNLLKVHLLDDKNIDLQKDYQFYFNLDGINFAFVGRPVKREGDRELLVLIKDSRIELRRYPRLKIPFDDLIVEIDGLKGVLRDVSLGGCRLELGKPIPSNFLLGGAEKVLTFHIPNEKIHRLKCKVVNVQDRTRNISCAFSQKDDKVIKLYRAITEYIRRKLESDSF